MAEVTTVTVGCKLPHGLHLDLFEKDSTNYVRETIKGMNAAEVIGGHGITVGVPKAHFDEWMRRNKNHPAVVNGLIFAHEKAESAIAMANERKANKTGFEGLDPEQPDPSGKITKDDGKGK